MFCVRSHPVFIYFFAAGNINDLKQSTVWWHLNIDAVESSFSQVGCSVKPRQDLSFETLASRSCDIIPTCSACKMSAANYPVTRLLCTGLGSRERKKITSIIHSRCQLKRPLKLIISPTIMILFWGVFSVSLKPHAPALYSKETDCRSKLSESESLYKA